MNFLEKNIVLLSILWAITNSVIGASLCIYSSKIHQEGDSLKSSIRHAYVQCLETDQGKYGCEGYAKLLNG